MSVTVMKPKKTPVAKPEASGEVAQTGRHPLLSLRDEIDHLFDNLLTGSALRPFGRWDLDWAPFKAMEDRFRATWPKVDVAETDKAYTITAELPGMDDKDIEVTLSDNCLTLSGEKRDDREEKEKNYHLTERSYGKVRRTFRVPGSVDEKKIDAHFDNGVLVVTLPKMKAAAAKKIAVSKGKKKS